MKSLVFICPYFGELPKDTFPFWLRSCANNNTIKWIIITDDYTDYEYPCNVDVHYSTLSEVKNLLEAKLNQPVELSTPYKLCDYKPMYGFLFSDLIKDFDYWGYCDISDTLFGDLRKFLTDDLLSTYPKIGLLGHLAIFENNIGNNSRFMESSESFISYKDIISTKDNMAFDEINSYSINSIFSHNGLSVGRIDDLYYDISPLKYSFQKVVLNKENLYQYKTCVPTVFLWNLGHLFCLEIRNGIIKREELAYIHFQKRKMNVFVDPASPSFIIAPKGFLQTPNTISQQYIYESSKNKIIYKPFFKLKYKALKYRIKNIISLLSTK